ncbi:MAG: phosphoribosylformylglycinamidine synthase subunit PurS [Bacteroidia bacterium]|nr:phosphoribosylformylglycinamidine synthase subunit PurS [Bacteroidia bacterium]NNC86565.1 phosphoribosylformylglycinamidine synthase subunit PurS [Bacteroidia bacterium]NNM16032.1 phosphoribosylformylglycinamidine synthase subunit PurS [Bacteroidia bacterium]
MKYCANITIMPLKALLDPQGKAVTSSMHNLNLPEISNVRIGKHVTLEIEADNEKNAQEKVENACKNLLANPIMESFKFDLESC